MNLYNDFDAHCCEWLRELVKEGHIAPGEVLHAPIQEIKPHELKPFIQFHAFCGVGGWPLAFRLAGIPDDEPADSGSCPCQPFSGTGKQLGRADPRHLWPAFRRQINRRRPSAVYGEQVASGLGRDWLAGVCSDLEIMGYGHTRADLCSAGVGSPNIRQRLFWVGYAMREGSLSAPQRGADCGEEGRGARHGVFTGSSSVDGLAESHCRQRDGLADGEGCERDRPEAGRQQGDGQLESCGNPDRVEHADSAVSHEGCSINGRSDNRGSEESRAGFGGAGQFSRLGYADHARRGGRLIRWDGGHQRTLGPAGLGMWADCDIIYCRDAKWRRIEPGSFPLADGIPSRVGPLLTELRKLGRSSIALARANRNIRLKGYGNAINPWAAARFIRAAEAARCDLNGRRGDNGNVAVALDCPDFEM